MNLKLRFGPRRASFRRPLFRRRTGAAHDVLTGPIRGELLGVEGLADRVRKIARAQVLRPFDQGDRRTPLLTRLDDTRQVLETARARLAAAADADEDIGPAGEWLLDNAHVVEEHVREVRESLPRDYYGELPELATGHLAGYPRVYEIATTLISHTEARIDLANVELVICAFQEVSPLSIGELWAVPAMLRLGLIESVRRMALRTMQRLDEVEKADKWAARIVGTNDPTAVAAALNEFIVRHRRSRRRS